MKKTTPTTRTDSPILAIDLGKYKSVACVYDRGTAQASFASFSTSKAELLRLLGRHRPVLVVIEACALAGWVHDRCGEHGRVCKVANTASEAWKFKHSKRKTDKGDAASRQESLACRGHAGDSGGAGLRRAVAPGTGAAGVSRPPGLDGRR